MTPEEAKQIARDIVDEACLGETFARNGTVAALQAAIEAALLKAGRHWQPITHDMPEGQQTVVFFDAYRREACFGTLETPRWRYGIVRTLLRAFGIIRPVPTHWIGLPNLPPNPALESNP